MQRWFAPSQVRFPWAVTCLGLGLVLAWDASGWDVAVARWFGGPAGFPWRDHWLLARVLHDDARLVGWGVVAALAVGWGWAWGPLRVLHRRERLGLLSTVLLGLLLVTLLKGLSRTSCPWSLQTFGGLAQHVSHWAWGRQDGGGGHCFPAGHAATGFAFVGAWFWLREGAPRAARWWLWGACLTGAVLGGVQQVRGAHFMSHTLWTAWLCWTASALLWWRWPRPQPARQTLSVLVPPGVPMGSP